METNINIIEPVLAKKMEGYGFTEQNFIASSEITVTITLSEYRSLVESNATRKEAIDKANKDKYERNNENERLKKEVAELRSKLCELTLKTGEEGEQEE